MRRPFDIGDRIAVSNVEVDTNTAGSLTWVVKDVTLFTTTVVLAASNEVATYSNTVHSGNHSPAGAESRPEVAGTITPH